MRADTFERSTLPHMPAVERFAESLTRDRVDAQDLVQETYLRALRGWHTFLPGSDPRKWLFTICRNTFLRWRQQRRSVVESEDGDIDAMPVVLSHLYAMRQGLDDLFERIDVGPAIERAINELPAPHRTVLGLVDIEGHTYQEAAAILEVPIGTVRSRLFRARRLIQDSLIAYAQDAGIAHTARTTRG